MSPSTAPPFCSLTRTARIVPLTRPQTVTPCAMMLPSTCAPSLIRRSEARNSPSIRPKTCAGPLHSILPTIDMSEPMQEAVPAFVVGSDLAQAWSCGCTILPMTSCSFAATLLSFSGAPLFMLFNMSASFFFRRYEAMRESGDSSTQHQRYHAARSDEPTGTHRSNFLVDIGSTPNSSRRTMPNAEPLGLAYVCRIVHRTPTSRPDARCLAMGLSWRGCRETAWVHR